VSDLISSIKDNCVNHGVEKRIRQKIGQAFCHESLILCFKMSKIKGLGKAVGPFLVPSHSNGNRPWAASGQTNKTQRQAKNTLSEALG